MTSIDDLLLAVLVLVGILFGIVIAMQVSQASHSLMASIAAANQSSGLQVVEIEKGNKTATCVYAPGLFTSQLDCDWRSEK